MKIPLFSCFKRLAVAIPLAAALLWGSTAPAAVTAQPTEAKPLEVGIYEAPPFCIKLDNGQWTGLSVELWERIARQLGIRYQWHPYSLEEMLKAAGNGDIDAGVGPVTPTTEREIIMDFTHPYYVSDLAIAVPSRGSFYPWSQVLREFLTLTWFKLFALLFLMLSVSGVAVWYFERQRNHNQFGGNWHHGLGAGFWWAAVTMSGVGYGDKAPVTAGGRLVALVWMFTSVITVALVTASVTSSVVANRASYEIHSPADLSHAKVAVLNGGTAEDFAMEARLHYAVFPTIDDGLNAVMRSEVDACVGNEAELRYIAKKIHPGKLEILPFTFQREDCAFIIPSNSPLREKINRVLLTEIQGTAWRKLRHKYLGD